MLGGNKRFSPDDFFSVRLRSPLHSADDAAGRVNVRHIGRVQSRTSMDKSENDNLFIC
jgi:hypothetical protein